ncbi:hypothetical protein AB4517_17815, partial [Vibrio sp. 10N.222.52.C3]|uniref:hypothetical protein n=1 Tax=Vibrio sp. 10N.222.52.C3 TaxID=3229631 RepID=UPI00354D8C6B
MSNILFIPSDRKVWIDFAQLLESKGAKIKMWVGPSSLDSIAGESFPNCTIYDFYNSHRGNTGVGSIQYSASKEVLGDPRFYILKDKAYKIMDRQDDLRIFSRLERESLFYLIFNSFYSEIIKNKIQTFVCGEAPHSTVGIILYGICELLDIPRYHLMGSSVVPAGHICKDFYGQKIPVSTLDNSFKEECKKHLGLFIDSFSSIADEPLYM